MSAPAPASSAVFYRWKDAQGIDHIVDSVEKVPEASRAGVERITLVDPAPRVDNHATTFGNVRVDWPSFSAGFAVAFLLGFLFIVARKTKRTWVELVIVVAIAAVIGGLYYAWPRPAAPAQGSQPVRVDDSNKTNEKMIKKLIR